VNRKYKTRTNFLHTFYNCVEEIGRLKFAVRTMKNMKWSFAIAVCLFAAASLDHCFGQTDTNLIATGNWSETVTENDHALRGRLLVYDDQGQSAANHARVYLELQHVFHGGWDSPIEIYFDVGFGGVVSFELNDAFGKPVPQEPAPIRGPAPLPSWVTLPCDATVRLRADIYNLGTQSKPAGLVIFANGGRWVIHPDATNDVFLSATFTPATNHPSPLNYHVWQGTLKVPAAKISAQTRPAGAVNAAPASLSYRDPDTGIVFSVESDGRHIAAVDRDGKILWRRQPGTDGNLPPYSKTRPQTNPVVTWIGALTKDQSDHLKDTGSGKFIGIGFNSRQGGVVDVKNGNFTFQGQD
jgi:hypothetical protein